MSAYVEGYEAASNDQHWSECPYTPFSEDAYSWHAGWEDADCGYDREDLSQAVEDDNPVQYDNDSVEGLLEVDELVEDNEELFDCYDEWKNAYLHGMGDAQSGSQPINPYPHNSDLFHAYNTGCHNAQLEEGVEEFVLDHDNLPF